MATLSRPTLNTLPEELLCGILAHLPARQLLHLLPASRRLHNAAAYLLSQRYTHVTRALGGFDLIFECYAPALRMNTTYQHCKYSHTAPLKPAPSTTTTTTTSTGAKGDADDLGALYTTFMPAPCAHQPAAQTVTLDSDEEFTQLVASAFYACAGPRRGLFTAVAGAGCKEHIVRVKRGWLDQAQQQQAAMLWIDPQQNLGVRVRVTQTAKAVVTVGGPRRGMQGEDKWLVEYEGVVVRTASVVDAMEEDGAMHADTGKAFGSRMFYCWPFIAQGPALVF